MILFNNKLEMLNTIMIIIIIVFLLTCFITNYFKSIENFSQSQYGLVACPPQFSKVGNTNNIYYNGNIGIGVASPTEHLTITGSATSTITSLGLRNGNGNGFFNNGAQISFGYNGTNQYNHFIHTRHNATNTYNAIDFYVCNGTQSNTVTSGSVHTMSLVSGKVGIGNTNPVYKLDVIDGGTYISVFRHTNLTQGIGIQYDGLTAMGSNTNQDIRIKSKNSGKVIFNTNNSDRAVFDGSGNLGIGITTPSEKLEVNGWIGRSAHNNGGLCGSYNNISENSRKTNPIYVIGSNYKPDDSSLKDMYGIGYTHTNASFINSGTTGWGMYVASDGDARIFLNGGTGQISCSDVIMPNLGSVYNRIYSKESSTIKRYTRKDVHNGAGKYADHFVVLAAEHRPPPGTRRIGHWTLTAIGKDGTTSLWNAGGTIMFTSHSWANVIGNIPWAWTYGANGHIYHNNNTTFPSNGGTMYGEVWYIDTDV